MDGLKLLSRSTRLRHADANSTPQNFYPRSANAPTQHEFGSETSRKRKRGPDLLQDNSGSSMEVAALSELEIRALHKKHNIKIIDLSIFRALDSPELSRKAQKESSRIFPQPITAFGQLQEHFHVNMALARNIAERAYLEPTEVQTATLSLLLKDGSPAAEPNLLTVAPTGSGKTLAFLIPLVDKISKAHQEAGSQVEKHVRTIILAPTKELVFQIVNEARKLATRTGVSITVVRKGMRLFEDAPETPEATSDSSADDGILEGERLPLKTSTLVKSDILVSTPLSLVRLICPSWDDDEDADPQPLPDVENLVFDEADVLLDPLFRSQSLAVWAACTSPRLRISMWSATIGSNVEELAIQTISERQKRLKIPRHERPPLLRTIIGLKDTSLPTISHRLVYTATESGKLLGMRQLLHPSRTTSASKGKDFRDSPLPPPFLVFAQTIDRAQTLFSELQYDIPAEAGGSSRVAVLHSALSQRTRSTIMKGFRSGKIWILITTDLLSRGVDFRGINVVVNYDIPTTVAGYVHRAGRTGRAGRKGGVCVSFYTKEDIRYVKGIANVIAASQKAQKNPDGAITDSYSMKITESDSTSKSGIEPWLLHALPSVSKFSRKDLKMHGVESRRAIHADDDEKTKRMKRKARIGTQSGYERRAADRKRGAVQGSLAATRKFAQEKEVEAWEGFG